MPSPRSKVIVACAGSRKTSHIVDEALKVVDEHVLITTYTNENVDQIRSYIIQAKGCIPPNITVMSWYSFLLQEGVRPYQNHVTTAGRVSTINFTARPNQYIPKTNVQAYYLTGSNDIYRDRVAEFVFVSNKCSGGRVVLRLAKVFRYIFIDEVQDLAGYDLELLKILFASEISIIAVGDPRQGTFTTNNAAKNKQFKKSQILEWINEQVAAGVFKMEEWTDCYRSNQAICDFSDALFPNLPKTASKFTTVTEHDGIFLLRENEVLEYVAKYSPVVLRYSKKTKTMGLTAYNMGAVKGRTYPRVLIFPTKPMKAYMEDKDLSREMDLPKFYVAVTRARHSVAFVM